MSMALPRTIVCEGSAGVTYVQPWPWPPPSRCHVPYVRVSKTTIKPGDTVHIESRSDLNYPANTDGSVVVAIYLDVAGRSVRIGGGSTKIRRGTRSVVARGNVKIPDLKLPPGRYGGRIRVRFSWIFPSLGLTLTGEAYVPLSTLQ